MYERYHVPKKEMPPLGAIPSKNAVVRSERCMNCGRCVDACIYKVHERDQKDPRVMAEPNSHLCKNCLRCVENCPQRALTVEYSPLYLSLGEGIWTPARVFTIWNESWTGKIPVFGAGYRGRYVGPGYDSMWTDMSEIVRPTRDGIHGREFISTSVDLGKRVDHLEFDPSGRLLTKMPRFVELPIPMIIDLTRIPDVVPAGLQGLMDASKVLETLLIVPSGTEVPNGAGDHPAVLVPVFPAGEASSTTMIERPRLVEMELGPEWRSDLQTLRSRYPESIIGARLQARNGIEPTVVELAASEVDLVHLLYDEQGKELGNDGRLARDSLMAINKAMAKESLRESVSIIAGGGLAAAEHIPKSLICGADALALERAIKVALGCHAGIQCTACPLDPKKATPEWVKWRVVNMMGAWRDQLLEVMGAMGIREARRLRGEIGRAIFYEEAEKDAFASLQGGA